MTLLMVGDLPAYELRDAYYAMRDHIYWVKRPARTFEEQALADNAWVRLCQAEARMKQAIDGGVH
jgi:hypothetical protein